MHRSSWVAFGFAVSIAAACGGSVSLGEIGPSVTPGADGGGEGGGGDGGTTTECASKTDCGPAPGAAAIQCSDGSLGGNTGRCLKTPAGCAWEQRECPPDACFDSSGVLDPSLKKCTSAKDCTIVTFQRDCCGTQRAAGVATANQAKVEKCAADRAAALPKCGCPTGPAVADDGSSTTFGSSVPPSLTCNGAGRCETSFTGEVCGAATCKPGEACCSGTPFPTPTCVGNGGCPISQRKMKKDIAYLSEADRERLKDELLRFPLATYRYKSEGEGDPQHLGFIIDDVAPSPAVQPSGERVDMYGYQTMAVAALQVQARELAALRRELDEVKAACASASKVSGPRR